MASGLATLDFGSTPTETATVSVVTSGLTSASFIEAFWQRENPGGGITNDADAHEIGGLFVPLVCEFVDATHFNIIAQSLMALATGTFQVRWVTL